MPATGGFSPASTRVHLSTLIGGFLAARGRLAQPLSEIATPPAETFQPLFEALHWAVAISLYAGEHGMTLPGDAQDWQGLRYVRNRSHHKFANASDPAYDQVQPRDLQSLPPRGGRPMRIEPAVAHVWRWVADSELPDADLRYPDKIGKDAYEARLATHPVHEVFDRVAASLDGWS